MQNSFFLSKARTLQTIQDLINLPTRKYKYSLVINKYLSVVVYPNGDKKYAATFRADGKRKLIQLCFIDELSIKKASERAYNLALNHYDKQNDSTKFRELVQRWLIQKKQTVRAITFKTYERIALKDLVPFHNKNLTDFNLDEIYHFFSKNYTHRLNQGRKVHKILVEIMSWDFNDLIPAKVITNINKKQFIKKLNLTTKLKHITTLTQRDKVLNFYQSIDTNKKIKPKMKLAIKFTLLTALRSKNICQLEWRNIDFKNEKLIFEAADMKNNMHFELPLSKTSLAILNKIKDLRPNIRPNEKVFKIAYTTLYTNFRRINALNLTPHSARSMFSTIANEFIHEHNQYYDMIEKYLAHMNNSNIRFYYNHAKNENQLRILADWWDNLLNS